MTFSLSRAIALLGMLSGCGAGVYGEVAATKLMSSSVDPGSGAEIEDVGGTFVGFNLGVDFGGLGKRFAVGYTNLQFSSDAGDTSFSGAAIRYDHGFYDLAERVQLRLGLGMDAGNATSTPTDGMEISDPAYVFTGGLGATYHLTWKTPIHVFAGAVWSTQEVPSGTLTGTGVTARVAVGYKFQDPRPDQFFDVAMEGSTDITGALEAGGEALGCRIAEESHGDSVASVRMVCPGDVDIEFTQTERYLYVRCRHEQSLARCQATGQAVAGSARKAID